MKNIAKLLSILLLVSSVVCGVFIACSKDSVKKEVFSGYAQKGPFVIGSSVTISELKANLDQTGKTYSTIISDNLGRFEEKNIELVSSYVELKVDGYYFHEVAGWVEGTLTLYALVDIKDVNSANVNVLTHLEKPRVEYLVKQGMSFSAAKQQAQREVLAIFGFSPPQTSSEGLDVINDAMLLAISCILQGNIAISGHLSELMANISADIKTDGKLDNIALGKQLMDNAIVLTTFNTNYNSTWLPKIRENLETKFNVTAPDFESYIQAFVNSDLYPRIDVY